MDEFEYKDIEETITLKNTKDESKNVECDVLFKLNSKEYNKKYIVYTDNYIDPENKLRTYASILVDDNGEYSLKEIEDINEYRYINNKINEFINLVKSSISKEELEKMEEADNNA